MYIQALLQEAQSHRGFRVSDVPPPFLFCVSTGGENGVDSTTTDHAPPTIHIGRRDLQPHSNVIEDLSRGGVVESEKKNCLLYFHQYVSNNIPPTWILTCFNNPFLSIYDLHPCVWATPAPGVVQPRRRSTTSHRNSSSELYHLKNNKMLGGDCVSVTLFRWLVVIYWHFWFDQLCVFTVLSCQLIVFCWWFDDQMTNEVLKIVCFCTQGTDHKYVYKQHVLHIRRYIR